MTGREVIVFVLTVLVVLLAGFLLMGLLWAFGGFGFSMLGPGMMRNCCGGLGWFLLCLVPLGLLVFVLVVGGLVWLVLNRST